MILARLLLLLLSNLVICPDKQTCTYFSVLQVDATFLTATEALAHRENGKLSDHK